MMRSPWLATHPGENFACHSRAMASKLSAPAWASFSARLASSGVDAGRQLLADRIALFPRGFSDTSGYTPSDRRFSLPP